ncbi:PP2C family protein-serine/threonine phosphatase [Streptomyces sp. NPDC051940]|uniref:PP2C family protein-serine/threonine phosphatase n=1 Tax=Streptomyces sp. NPDC051940 TaxID=3155675 RepID=UPI003446AD66
MARIQGGWGIQARDAAAVTRAAALGTAIVLYGVVIGLQFGIPIYSMPSILVALPAVLALAFGPGMITGAAGLAVATRWTFVEVDHRIGAAIGTTLMICAIAALGCFTVHRREEAMSRLFQISSVAEAAQRAVLRPPPPIVGQFHTAARYQAAAEHAHIGGDLYAVADTEFGVRTLIGDVRGKGMDAVATVSAVLGSFHEAAYDRPNLERLAGALDTSLRRFLDDAEEFVTVFLMEIAPDGRTQALSCGHPAPLLLRGDAVLDLPTPAGLPLGLRPLAQDTTGHESTATNPDAWTYLRPGDTVLLYTDGLAEARDASGEFYPIARRLADYPRRHSPAADPADLLDWLEADAHAYAGRDAHDDSALLVLAWPRTPGIHSTRYGRTNWRDSGGSVLCRTTGQFLPTDEG